MLLLLGTFLLLMVLGLPVALSMAVSSLLFILVTGITPDVTLAQRMIAGVESFPLLAVPFFILAGNLMNIAGVTGRIYRFAVSLVGWMKGGLGHVNIIGSVIFSGMSGTAIADAAGLGTIEIKAMKDHGYPVEVAVGVTAASATAITADELISLVYSLKAPYRSKAKFLMNDATVAAIRKLKDLNGVYVWQPALTAGEPDRLLGYPLYTSPKVPTMAAGARVIAFGDFSCYWIADRAGRTIKRLNELFATNGQVGFT